MRKIIIILIFTIFALINVDSNATELNADLQGKKITSNSIKINKQHSSSKKYFTIKKIQKDGRVFISYNRGVSWTEIHNKTEIENDFEDIVNVYPNPASNIFNISVEDETPVSIVITNSLGNSVKVINDQNLLTNNISINIDDLPNGLYTISLNFPDGNSVIKKIIKI